jgi:predicted NUDIX family NTP pyrophosphohydrolase
LVYRPVDDGIEVLAVHPGGPFFAKKDDGVWSIPKGELDAEEPYVAARREFAEELGQPAPSGEPVGLGTVRQAGGKVVHAWALRAEDGDVDTSAVKSNTVDIEWPRGSGRRLTVPEVDRAAWMSPETARLKLIPAQVELVDRVLDLLGIPLAVPPGIPLGI